MDERRKFVPCDGSDVSEGTFLHLYRQMPAFLVLTMLYRLLHWTWLFFLTILTPNS